jgi:protein-tyrosine-phosphatase
MNHTILFLCPHAAAKSVLAVAYFQRIADARGLPVRADAAGTDPDAHVSPAVVEFLRADGLDVSTHQPRRVTTDELQSAWRVVSLGCDPTELPVARPDLIRWDDVPPVSQNIVIASAAIHASVKQLVGELSQITAKKLR